uniref:RNA methyltransferase n=1 Tax=Phallusia mammillata TaxID=59560 RepID=A0A6F9DJY0_9ASCI|nr:7SK snRNA methylphosphate capping enzyme-like [Phallusia mammillata]
MTSPKCDNGIQDPGGTDNGTEKNEMKPPQAVKDTMQAKELFQVAQMKARRVHRKRRHSTSEDFTATGGKKHRRQPSGHHKKGSAGDIILPTKFLLGGNISDPLNLNSLLDENVNKALNAVTPTSSPLPPRSSTVNIVIPPDMTDPLGLNSSVGSPQTKQNEAKKQRNDSESADLSTGGDATRESGKKKRKRRKSQHGKALLPESGDTMETTNGTVVDSNGTTVATVKNSKQKKAPPHDLNLQGHGANPNALTVTVSQITSVDPIVSPVIPQDVKSSSSLSASKQKKKRNSVACGKQLAFNIGGDMGPSKISSHDNNLLLATDIDTQHKLVNDKTQPEATAIFECTAKDNTNHAVAQKSNTHNKSSQQHKGHPKFRANNTRFQFGNYNQYYGYRNPQKFKDDRMELFKKEWFKEKDVLDVGCNVGHLTLLIARDFEPRKIVGVDIDDNLIKVARTNIRHYSTAEVRSNVHNGKYPECMSVQYGPIHGPPVETGKNDSPTFPNNVKFFKGNYVPLKEEVLNFQEPEYDVIMCMSVTKWIHLNWGDEGLTNTFRRFFKQLRPGGKLILEPQDWSSYKKKKKLTETIYQNFYQIKLMPASFPNFLTKSIGFEKVEYLQNTSKDAKGFKRPIQVFHKPE